MPPHVFLVHGPDEFAGAGFLQALRASLGEPSVVDLNTTVFDGRSLSLSELRAVSDTLPFLAPRRLVVVEGWLTRLQQGKADESEDEAPEAAASESTRETLTQLAAYLPQVPESTTLVLLEKRTLNPRHPVLRALGGEWGEVKFFDLPKGPALAGWIRARAKQAGGEFTREAAQALAAAEADPRALDQEITKLLTYVDLTRPVEAEDVERLTPAGGEARVFDLVDAIGQRQGPQAMRELHRLLETEEPLFLLGMIVRQFRLILQARELLEARASPAQVAERLGLHPFPAEKVCSQARHYSLPALERIYHRLLDYDVAIKTGQFDAAAALDTLVVGLTAV